MSGIPPALETDSEDVAWALHTAEALWKRRERADALVWLRRAAQAASDAEDDDRALSLAREAADLAERFSKQRSTESLGRLDRPLPRLPIEEQDLPRRPPSDSVDEVTLPEIESQTMAPGDHLPLQFPTGPFLPAPSAVPPASSVLFGSVSHTQTGLPASATRSPTHSFSTETRRGPQSVPPPLPGAEALSTLRQQSAAHVPTAAKAHAGILDPWAEGDLAKNEISSRTMSEPLTPTSRSFGADEIVTSAPLSVLGLGERMLSGEGARREGASEASAGTARLTSPVDLSQVEAFTDLPDDARDAFARSATLSDLAPDEEISGFAVAHVILGSVEVASTIADAMAVRLSAGRVLRVRGTVERVAPLRLVASIEGARVATWSERDVGQAFRSCPWVEEELRSASDRVHALVGVTLGRLGNRLAPALRMHVTERLALRVLSSHEIFARAGEPVPGLLIVGAGELALTAPGDAKRAVAILRAGDFLFPNEVLRGAVAPNDARAGEGGALVLVADRAASQELLVTCSPLLELFAEG